MNVTPQQQRSIIEWFLQGYQLYENEVGEHVLSLFYNQRDQDTHYELYMSYIDVTTMGLSHRLSTHGTKEYLIVYMQPSICQLPNVLAHHNIEIGDIIQFIKVQQNDIYLLLDRFDNFFSEVYGALVHMDNHVLDVCIRLDELVPQLNQGHPE